MYFLSVYTYSLYSGDISSHFDNIYYTRFYADSCVYLVGTTTYCVQILLNPSIPGIKARQLPVSQRKVKAVKCCIVDEYQSLISANGVTNCYPIQIVSFIYKTLV